MYSRRLVCLFVWLLFVLYLVVHEHVIFASLLLRLMVPREILRVEGGRVFGFFLLRFGSHILFDQVSMAFLFYHAPVDTAARLRDGTGSSALSSRIFVRTYFFPVIFALNFFNLIGTYQVHFLKLAEGRFSSRRCFQHVVLHQFQSGPINYTAVSIITLGPVEVV